jgi:hypothetical protein
MRTRRIIELLSSGDFEPSAVEPDRAALELANGDRRVLVLRELAPVSTITSLVDHAWEPGLRLVPNTVLAAHWEALDSFLPGLQGVVQAATLEHWTLVAIEERTAAVGDGIDWQVPGRGVVIVARAGHRLTFRRAERFRLPAVGATGR